jgi:hypothetical protein
VDLTHACIGDSTLSWEASGFEISLFGISKTLFSKLFAGPQPGSSLETPLKNQLYIRRK